MFYANLVIEFDVFMVRQLTAIALMLFYKKTPTPFWADGAFFCAHYMERRKK